MSDKPHEPMTELDARNAKLEDRFVASRLYDPSLERKIKPNAHVVLIPTQDPELEARNRAYAKQLQAKGDQVQLISESDLMSEADLAKRQQAGRDAYLEALSGLKERLERGEQG
ncbi:hypothetical protein D3C72_119900 [compost metagenome]